MLNRIGQQVSKNLRKTITICIKKLRLAVIKG